MVGKGGTGPQLLAVDLDGTLLDRQGRPHERDVRAIRAALRAGVRVTLATGRLYSGTRAAAELLGLQSPVACLDGSHLVRAIDHETLLHLGVRGPHLHRVRDVLARARVTTFVFAQDAIGHDAAGDPYVGYVSTWSTDVRACRDVFEHELWRAELGVTGVVALGTQDRVAAAVDQLAGDLAGALMTAMFPVRRGGHDGLWAMMIRSAGSTKGTAVRWIAQHEGVRIEDTVCVGDWMNDLPMFEVAGRSFAMGQAPDEVKARATNVLRETCDEGGGVAQAISEAFGITSE